MDSIIDELKKAEEVPESIEVADNGDTCSVQYIGPRIKTVDELIELQNVDLSIWEVTKPVIKAYGVSGKRKTGKGHETLWQATNLSISFTLVRRAPKPIQDAIRGLLADVKPLAIKPPTKVRKGGKNMMEVGLFDSHFGKRSWAKEVGHNYDLKIAEQEFCAAIDEMIDRVAGYNIDQIIFPLGNDFFHVNDWMGQTANGTRLFDSSVDDRFSLVFRTGCRAVQYAIERCAAVAKTKVLWVPGNHDRHTSWYMTEFLSALFRGSRVVEVDNSPGNRKYTKYGVSLLGYIHGDEIKHSDLPTLMAQERPHDWASTTFRSWRLGHWHKSKETRYVVGDTLQGVEVKLFPSLCGTDSWHYANGYVGNSRMAECHLWSFDNGPNGYFPIHSKGQRSPEKPA
jgi:hypothetical protein